MLSDSQVIVKFMEEDSSGRLSARHSNLAPVSSFVAEYSSMEVVVERPVPNSTSTEALMEIPRQKTNKHCPKTLTRKKMCNDQNTAHRRAVMRVQRNSSQQNNLQQLSLSDRIKPSVYAIFINVKFFFRTQRQQKGWWMLTFPISLQRFIVLEPCDVCRWVGIFCNTFSKLQSKKREKKVRNRQEKHSEDE